MTRADEHLDAIAEARERAPKEPLGVDISDYSDEFCAGFLAGQDNAFDFIAAALASLRQHLQGDEEALRETREHRRLQQTLLRGAWDELAAAEEHHRWHHEREGREVEPREERLRLLMELAEALDDESCEPYASASDVLAATVNYLASLHHRTIEGSRKHDPERIDDFAACPCLSCRKAAAALRLSERAALAASSEGSE